MLTNIFLFIGKNFQDLNQLNIYGYPNDIINFDDKDTISKVIYGHDHGDLVSNSKILNSQFSPSRDLSNVEGLYLIDNPIPQIIDGLNIYTSCINGKIIIGLVFDKEDNPYDYKDIFNELLDELLNVEKSCAFEDEIEIENFLITIFIDIRRFGDEQVERRPQIEFRYQESFIKVFLFGIDDVGKSSLVRRIKTGEFNDNYFMPTKKFSIDYVQAEEKGFLAFWDMPGQRSFRKKWLIGLQDSNIVIYMIDVANQRRFEESKKEFWKIINRYDLLGIPVLILANKIDLIQHSDEITKEQSEKLKNEIITYFEFDKIQNREWKFLFTSVKTKFNIETVMKEIFDLI
ncbi:MAG: ADP-ribosylation factor-like protein [Promethearchaeota archaeon]